LKFTSLHVLVSGHTCWIQYQALHSNQIQYAADNFQLEQLYWPDTLVLCNQPLLAWLHDNKKGRRCCRAAELPPQEFDLCRLGAEIPGLGATAEVEVGGSCLPARTTCSLPGSVKQWQQQCHPQPSHPQWQIWQQNNDELNWPNRI
jgi:hypothetical protein